MVVEEVSGGSQKGLEKSLALNPVTFLEMGVGKKRVFNMEKNISIDFQTEFAHSYLKVRIVLESRF